MSLTKPFLLYVTSLLARNIHAAFFYMSIMFAQSIITMRAMQKKTPKAHTKVFVLLPPLRIDISSHIPSIPNVQFSGHYTV